MDKDKLDREFDAMTDEAGLSRDGKNEDVYKRQNNGSSSIPSRSIKEDCYETYFQN